jgi:hypothetical protein
VVGCGAAAVVGGGAGVVVGGGAGEVVVGGGGGGVVAWVVVAVMTGSVVFTGFDEPPLVALLLALAAAFELVAAPGTGDVEEQRRAGLGRDLGRQRARRRRQAHSRARHGGGHASAAADVLGATVLVDADALGATGLVSVDVGVGGVGEGVVGVGDGVVGVVGGVVLGAGVVGRTVGGLVAGWLAEGLGVLLLVALPGLVTLLLAWAAAAATELGPAGGTTALPPPTPLPAVLVAVGALLVGWALLWGDGAGEPVPVLLGPRPLAAVPLLPPP